MFTVSSLQRQQTVNQVAFIIIFPVAPAYLNARKVWQERRADTTLGTRFKSYSWDTTTAVP